LVAGELALNTADGKLFYKDSSGVVQTMASKGTGSIGGSTTQVQFNNSGVLGGSANLTFNGTTLTAAGLAGPHNGTVGATTPATGAFTSVDYSTTLTGGTGIVNLGSGQFYKDASGNVGVGTTSPYRQFQVGNYSANAVMALGSSPTGTGTLVFSTSDSAPGRYVGTIDYNHTSNYLAFTTNASERMRLDSSGNLLVNTTSAVTGSKLVVASGDVTIYGLTVGRGAGAFDSNTAVSIFGLSANTTGINNTAIGRVALWQNTTGSQNSASGVGALGANTTGSNNTAHGVDSLRLNTTASNNTAVGFQAGFNNTTGADMVAVGKGALFAATTGNSNTAVGNNALTANTTASNNTAVGDNAGAATTTGANNTIVGKQALQANTTASNNTAVGYQAGYSNTTGTRNTLIGEQSGRSITTNSFNTFVGNHTGENTTGGYNTFLGDYAGYLVTTGTKHLILGKFDGNSSGLDIRTASNYIVLADGDGNLRGIFTNDGSFLVGTTALNSVSNYFSYDNGSGIVRTGHVSGTASGTAYSVFAYNGGAIGSITQSGTTAVLYNVTSDQRLKENISDADSASELIDSLQVRKFDWKTDQTHQRYGFVAQELVTVVPEAVHQPADSEEMMAVDYSKLVPMLVKEIQSLRKRLADAGI
jgi:hypothetical protein